MNPEELNGHWHLRKEVSFGHIISTVALVIMFIAGWVNIQTQLALFEQHIGSPSHEITEARVDLLEKEVAQMGVIDRAMVSRIDNLQNEIIRRLERIEDRLNEPKD